MTEHTETTRREFIVRSSAAAAACGLAGCAGLDTVARSGVPQRPIPSTGEMLPVIGLGSSKVVEQIAQNGTEPLANVLRALVAHGGKLVDTWPRNAANDAGLGRVLALPELRDKLFVTTKVDQVGKDVGVRQFRDALRNYQRETIDLVQIFSLTDLDTHWPSLKEWKAQGAARYIGVTVSQDSRHADLEQFLRRERPDFVQMNYSITERAVEERLLPFAADRGAAVVINRPFMNGAYFDRLEGKPLPEWAREVGCATWAQFSLKYILANPSLTSVLTETSDPKHMEENLLAAVGPLPDAAARQRMREFIATV
ncbi:MAG TPA: aldo/keto reductase [Gammaproteobacteria bacterium]|nr:aldo/keto reductase [Gammaproteobacteria bacterium]